MNVQLPSYRECEDLALGALRDLGGVATPKQIASLILARERFTADQLAVLTPKRERPAIRNRIEWAGSTLDDAKLIVRVDGCWILRAALLAIKQAS